MSDSIKKLIAIACLTIFLMSLFVHIKFPAPTPECGPGMIGAMLYRTDSFFMTPACVSGRWNE